MELIFSQVLTGLASASSLFLVACGLTIIFGVTRIVNFAHGSLYMLGAYLAVDLIGWFPRGGFGFWAGVVVAALMVGVIGAAVEALVLRRIYRAPELFPLLATFGVVLIVQDLALWLWGPEDKLGPRAPGLKKASEVFGARVPDYDLFLIALAPAVLAALWLVFHKTRWGVIARAATEDGEMASALGVDRAKVMTGVFFLGSALAGLGGAIQLPKAAASLSMDLSIIAEVFVVTVVGGMGSILGAYLAAVLISVLKALAVANAGLSLGGIAVWQLELVLVFLVMAAVLIVRPYGLLGRAEAHEVASGGHGAEPLIAAVGPLAWGIGIAAGLAAAAAPFFISGYPLIVATEIAIMALFAASLHFLMGLGGVVSFGHAAYFGLGAYGSALLAVKGGAPMWAALLAGPLAGFLGAGIFGWFCVRLSGVYLAMLTLAFAQIAWAVVFQWVDVTGGDNGLLGVWPSGFASAPEGFFALAAIVCGAGLLALRGLAFTPFGYGLRAVRDSERRAEAIGLDARAIRWAAFAIAGGFAGVAGALFAFFKGNVGPDLLAIPLSVDALVMALAGGVQTLFGPVMGAAGFVGAKIELISLTNYWRAILGALIVALVIFFPQGIVGAANRALLRDREEGAP